MSERLTVKIVKGFGCDGCGERPPAGVVKVSSTTAIVQFCRECLNELNEKVRRVAAGVK